MDLPEYIKDLFKVLISMAEWCFRLQYRFGAISGQPYESLFHDLLSEEPPSSDLIGEKAQRISIPFSGYFRLYLLMPVEPNRFTAEQIRRYLADRLPEAKIFVWDQNIAILVNYGSEEEAAQNEVSSGPVSFCLSHYGLYCGVSRLFFTLTDLKTAYDQAGCSIFYGHRLSRAANLQKKSTVSDDPMEEVPHPNIFYYENTALYQMIEYGLTEKKEIFRFNPFVRSLERLQKYDLAKGTSYYQVLFIYLSLERHATDAAHALHMHRTNLLYHLEKIQEIISGSLDDAEVRLNYLIAYRAKELLE